MKRSLVENERKFNRILEIEVCDAETRSKDVTSDRILEHQTSDK